MCQFMLNWPENNENGRKFEYKEWLEDILSDMGLDPDEYTIKFQGPPDPETGEPTDHAGGYDNDSNTIYIHPGHFEGDSVNDAYEAMKTGAHEARHALQQDVYWDYGVEWSDSPLDQSIREQDAKDFGDSYIPDLEEECRPSEESSSDGNMPLPPSPAGDFSLPPGDIANV